MNSENTKKTYPAIEVGLFTHLSRSGSTLLARMLEEYDDVCVTTEAELPLELFGVKSYTPIVFKDREQLKSYFTSVMSQTRFYSWELSQVDIIKQCESYGFPLSGTALVQVILNQYLLKYKPQAKLVLYKACPLMPWHLPELVQHFPEAPLVHVIRDPRAVYHSQLHSMDPFTGKVYSTSALRTALDWQAAAKVKNELSPEQFIEVRYEDLINSPQETLQTLVKSLGLSSTIGSGGKSQFIDRMDSRDQQLHKEIVGKPDPEKIEAWKSRLTARDIYIIEKFLGEQLAANFYSDSDAVQQSSFPFGLLLKFYLMLELIKRYLRRSKRVLGRLSSNPAHLKDLVKLKVKSH